MTDSSRKDEAKILYKLMRLVKWEPAHTSIDNLTKGFPKHKRGEIKKLIPGLIKKRLLHVKPTAYGREVSLNVKRKKEIEELISRFFE